jgi:hypothetical protein
MAPGIARKIAGENPDERTLRSSGVSSSAVSEQHPSPFRSNPIEINPHVH